MDEFELEPGEQITRSVRLHWIVLVGSLAPFVLLAILPIFIPVVVTFLKISNPTGAYVLSQSLSHNVPWIIVLVAFWWLFLWLSAFSIFTQYYLTLWIITTTRIVYIHQWGFFSRQVSSFLLNRVQDVTTDIEGFLPTMFGFGTLDVETAGRDEKFKMRGIKNPTELRDLIMREIADLSKTPGAQQSASTGV